MSKKRPSSEHQRVTIEVCGSVLRMVISNGDVTTGNPKVLCKEISWRQQANSLLTEIGAQELSTAFKRLAEEYKLAGKEVTILLNGTFCVTRVITGEVSNVKHEIADLEQRSQLYLSLGPGHKALAGCTRHIDARHHHALLTVTNRRTLDTVLEASSHAGWHVKRIHPSLFALSRTLEQLGLDRENPIMVLSLDEKGVEVGIFFHGMLLLDYRPGGREVHQNVAQIISQHLPRLQRYCSRYFQFTTGKLHQVLVCGERQHAQRVLADFGSQENLTGTYFELEPLATQWQFSTGVPESTFAAVLGSTLVHGESSANYAADDNAPNLLKNLQQQQTISLGHELRKLAWPVIAAAAVIVAVLSLIVYQRSLVENLTEEIAEFEAVRNRAKVLRLSLVQSETKGKMLTRLSYQLTEPDWSKLWTTVGGCLPPNVWVDSFHLENGEKVSISGTCLTENGVFEFVRWLKQVPDFEEVALTTTRPVRHESKPAISFQLECQLVNLNEYSDGKD